VGTKHAAKQDFKQSVITPLFWQESWIRAGADAPGGREPFVFYVTPEALSPWCILKYAGAAPYAVIASGISGDRRRHSFPFPMNQIQIRRRDG